MIRIFLAAKLMFSLLQTISCDLYGIQVNSFLSVDAKHQFHTPFEFAQNNVPNVVDKNGNIAIRINFKGQEREFVLHRGLKFEGMSSGSIIDTYGRLKHYIEKELNKGVNPELIQARLLYGGHEDINKIFEHGRALSNFHFPFVSGESRGMALGLSMITDNSSDLVLDFAKRTHTSSFRTWAEDGYLLDESERELSLLTPGSNLRSAFHVTERLDLSIHFNLDHFDFVDAHFDIQRINEHLEERPSNLWNEDLAGRYGFTNFEMRQILHHRNLYDRTIFYREGEPISAEERMTSVDLMFLGK